MISCTLQTLPTWNPANILPKGCEPSTSSSFQTSKAVVQAWTKDFGRASFATCPQDSHSSPVVLRTVWHQFGNGGKRLRSFSNKSHLWNEKGSLLPSGEELVKDGTSRGSRTSDGSHLLHTDRRGLKYCRSRSKEVIRRNSNRSTIIRSSSVNGESEENEYCDRSHDQPHGACSFRRSSRPSTGEGTKYMEVPEGSDPDQSGYTIKVSKELMGVFRYVEKVKRARIKELASTLRQTAAACMFFSVVRGILGPLVEVFKTEPPSWARLILMLSAFDSFAITYLALKASEPLEKLSMLASESEKDIMGSIEKEEEQMLALAVELVKLFRRLRNIVVCTAVAQFASLIHSFLRLNNPKLVSNIAKIIGVWLNTPWN